MIGVLLVVAALIAPFFFPLWFSAALAGAAAFVSPFAPLATGLVLDALYYGNSASFVPLYTIIGLAVSLLSYGVRRFIQTSIMHA